MAVDWSSFLLEGGVQDHLIGGTDGPDVEHFKELGDRIDALYGLVDLAEPNRDQIGPLHVSQWRADINALIDTHKFQIAEDSEIKYTRGATAAGFKNIFEDAFDPQDSFTNWRNDATFYTVDCINDLYRVTSLLRWICGDIVNPIQLAILSGRLLRGTPSRMVYQPDEWSLVRDACGYGIFNDMAWVYNGVRNGDGNIVVVGESGDPVHATVQLGCQEMIQVVQGVPPRTYYRYRTAGQFPSVNIIEYRTELRLQDVSPKAVTRIRATVHYRNATWQAGVPPPYTISPPKLTATLTVYHRADGDFDVGKWINPGTAIGSADIPLYASDEYEQFILWPTFELDIAFSVPISSGFLTFAIVPEMYTVCPFEGNIHEYRRLADVICPTAELRATLTI